MPRVAVLDACVLHPAPLRDLLVRVAAAGLVNARWTDDILDECFRSILATRPDLKPDALVRTRALMNRAVPDARVDGHLALVSKLVLPDPDDRHVLAAAIRSGAEVIVTRNLRDFPATELAKHGLRAEDPDDFVLRVVRSHGAAVARILEQQANDLRSPPRSLDDLYGMLDQLGLTRAVRALRTRGDRQG